MRTWPGQGTQASLPPRRAATDRGLPAATAATSKALTLFSDRSNQLGQPPYRRPGPHAAGDRDYAADVHFGAVSHNLVAPGRSRMTSSWSTSGSIRLAYSASVACAAPGGATVPLLVMLAAAAASW